MRRAQPRNRCCTAPRVVSGHVAYQPGHVAGQRMLRTDLVAQLELLTYRIEYEARLPAEQAHAEAIERVDVLVSIQVPQMRALGSLDNGLVGHLLEHRLEAVDHAWVGHVATVGLRVLLRLAGA